MKKLKVCSSAKQYFFSVLLSLLAVFSMFVAVPVRAESVIATIETGAATSVIEVNSVTNKIYGTNCSSNAVTVIDGATNATTTVNVGGCPTAIAINPVTNKIYVVNTWSDTVTVIDGVTNFTEAVEVGRYPNAIAVNLVTNQIYVVNNDTSNVTVIDGDTNATATIGVGSYPDSISVNPVTNKIYVANNGTTYITVIDGYTNNTSTIEVGFRPWTVLVNPVTNKIYVGESSGSVVVVIDGDTGVIAPLAVGSGPYISAVNSVTNKIYVPSLHSNNFTVIDGDSNDTSTIVMEGHSAYVAVNQTTNKIYVTNYDSDSVTIIDGVSNSISTIPVGAYPQGIAVNPITNLTYVANSVSNTISVIGELVDAAPLVSGSQIPLANTSGWNNTDVTVTFSATDDSSIPVCTVYSVTLADEGEGQVVNAICTDVANNSTNASRIVNIDKTAPGLVMPSFLASYLLDSSVSINFYAIETLSQLDSLSATLNGNPVSSGSTVVLNQAGVNTFMLTATDKAGNTDTQTLEFIVIDDATPLAINVDPLPLANANGWHNTDVTVTFTGLDNVYTPTCTVTTETLTTEGAGQVTSTVCTDAAGNSTTVSRTFNIDKTAPVLTMPSLEGSYGFNSSLVLTFSATDALSQLDSISASMNGNPVSSGSPVVLTRLGTNTFVLTATDKAGNTISQTQQFSVNYIFGGFLPPLTADSRTTFHKGSVIPVKFDLYDANGTAISTAIAHLSLQKYSGADPIGDPINVMPTSGADSGNLFRYSGGHYTYNLSTKPFSSGTWRIQVALDDGTVRTIDIGLTSK